MLNSVPPPDSLFPSAANTMAINLSIGHEPNSSNVDYVKATESGIGDLSA